MSILLKLETYRFLVLIYTENLICRMASSKLASWRVFLMLIKSRKGDETYGDLTVKENVIIMKSIMMDTKFNLDVK
uniref:Uncharacterized protein n=1 Tax=Halalkalibacterium halodurans TaxID=86665 RepID=A0A0M0KED6_ALKHA